MAGVELATAYVTLAATAQGLRESIREEFRQVERDAQDAGHGIGQQITHGVQSSVQAGQAIADDVADGMNSAASDAAKQGQNTGGGFARGLRARIASASASARGIFSRAPREGAEAGSEAGKSFSKNLSAKLKDSSKQVIAAAGFAGIGATLAKGVADALDMRQVNANLTAQMGLTQQQAARAGAAAGKLFSGNMGDSAEIGDAMKAVMTDIDGMRNASEKTLESMGGKALTVSKTFDQDLGGVTRAVSQMLRTGMAKSADEAFDIVTKGFQSGADKSEDFLDTLNEYGTQFRKMGIDGTTATGLISQGLKAGARDGDLVADAIKEFSIRAIDGSKTTVSAYKDLGLSADAMTAKIAKGGPAAKQGLGEILTRLRAVKDPAQQAQIATSLFGTQAEDLGKALFALHPETAAKGLGQVAGATDKANAAVNSTPQAKLQNFIRSLQGGLVEVLGTKVIPAMERFKEQFDKGEGAGGQFRDALEKVRDALSAVFSWVSAHPDLTKGLVAGVGGLLVLKKSVNGISSAVRGVSAAASGVRTGLGAARNAASSTARAFSGLKTGLSGAQPPKPTAWTAAGNAMRNAGSAVKGYATSAAQASRAALATAANVARQGAASALAATRTALMTGATKAWALAQRALNLVMRMNPIGLIITALVALGLALVVAYQKSETFRNIVQGAWNAIKAAALAVWNWMRDTLFPGLKAVWDKLSGAFVAVKDAIVGAWNKVTDKFTAVWNWISGVFQNNWRTILVILSGPIGWAVAAVRKHWDAIVAKFTAVKNWVVGAFKATWNGVVSVITWPVSSAVGWVRKHWDDITAKFTAVKNWVVGVFKRAWDGLTKIITDPVQAGKNMINNVLGGDDKSGLRGLFSKAVSAIGGIWEKLKEIVKKPIQGVLDVAVNPFIRGFNKLGGSFGLHFDEIKLAAGGQVPGRANGGTIPGPWRGPRADNVLGVSDRGMPVARVNPGEYITNVASTNRMERRHPGALAYINRFGDLPGHASGGFAGMPHANTGAPHTARGRYESYRPSVSIVALGRYLQSKGFQVGQHPAFGGVARVHMPTSLHYAGQALDVNHDQGNEDGALSALASALVHEGWGTIWHSAGHFDHLHVDTGIYDVIGGKTTAISKTNALADALSSVTGFVSDYFTKPLKTIACKAIDSISGRFGGGDFAKKIVGGMAKKFVDGALSWGDGKASSDYGGAEVNETGVPASLAANRAAVQAAAAKRGWGSGAEWNALSQLVGHESGWRNTVKNPSSTAYGMFQFLDSSWSAVHPGAHRTSDSNLQAQYGMEYIAQRYGSPSKAWEKWLSRSPHWYADGGLVRDIPVFDRGGTLAPGVNVVNNKLGRPEPLVRTEDVLQERKGDVNITVNGVHYDNAHDVARELNHELRRIDMAGRYGRV